MPEEWEPQGSDVDLPQEPEAVYFSRALGLLARPRHRKSALHLHNHHHASERAGAATPRSDAHDLRPPMGRQSLERPFGSRGRFSIWCFSASLRANGSPRVSTLVNHWRTTRRLHSACFTRPARKVAVVAAHEALVFLRFQPARCSTGFCFIAPLSINRDCL